MSTNPYAPPRDEREGPREIAPDGKTCPRCGAQVSFLRVYLAVGPSFIRCGQCGVRVGFDHLNAPGLLLTLLLLAVAGGSTLLTMRTDAPAWVTWPLTFVLGAALVTAPILEWVRRHRRLRVTE